MTGTVLAVCISDEHAFSKQPVESVRLLSGIGLQGDAHAGRTVQHLSRQRRDPTLPNLRQVHLLHAELLEALTDRGFDLSPGDVGENVLVRGVPLLDLPAGTRLHLGGQAVVEVTGLRNPCVQLDRFADGLMSAMLRRDAEGGLVRLAGVMAVVCAGGDVRAGDTVRVVPPPLPHRPLGPV